MYRSLSDFKVGLSMFIKLLVNIFLKFKIEFI